MCKPKEIDDDDDYYEILDDDELNDEDLNIYDRPRNSDEYIHKKRYQWYE